MSRGVFVDLPLSVMKLAGECPRNGGGNGTAAAVAITVAAAGSGASVAALLL